MRVCNRGKQDAKGIGKKGAKRVHSSALRKIGWIGDRVGVCVLEEEAETKKMGRGLLFGEKGWYRDTVFFWRACLLVVVVVVVVVVYGATARVLL
jgi:hypothetical protein